MVEGRRHFFPLRAAAASIERSINFTNRQIDPTTGSLLVQALFPNSNQLLRPGQFVKVSESCISGPEIITELKTYGYRGFLIGESFMKTDNPGKALSDFIQ